MDTSFQTIIYFQRDESNSERGVWVRVSPSPWGVSIATFRERPAEGTQEWDAITSLHFDPCFSDKSKVTCYNEHTDPERGTPHEVPLVESIDKWKPRPE